MTSVVNVRDERTSAPRSALDLLAAQVARTPDAPAVVFGEERLSFRELDERANQVGHYLRGLGVGPDAVVGLCLPRSLDMIVGLFGILKAGGAYLPVEADLPAERLALILDSARPRVILTHAGIAGGLPSTGAALACLDADRAAVRALDPAAPELDLHPANLAYVIYTSGSTGVPKGIMIDHQALRDKAAAKTAIYGFQPGDRVLQFTALSFDAAAAEIYPSLLAGATLVVHPNPTWTSPAELLADCERHGITSVMLPPVYLQLLVDHLAASGRSMPWLRHLITGGENLPVERLAEWARLVPHPHRFVYAYGPTETTIAATLYLPDLDPGAVQRLTKVPIGQALPQTGVHVLDPELRPVPAGEAGELWITGTGLARGYLGDAALTADRFLPDPHGGVGERMYRTGDLARQTADGGFEFIGRVDEQVKIRGFRVDLGDVQTALADHPDVGQAVVIARDGQLLAYYVAAHPTSGPVLRTFLGTKLPSYMIPSAFVALEAIPLTSGGKIDHHALPAPAPDGEQPDADTHATLSPVEEVLSGIWCDLLGRERIGVDEDFFAAGGDSLLANQVVSRVRDALGVEVPLRSMFTAPTIAALAQEITALSIGDADELLALLAEVEQSGADGGAGHSHSEHPGR